MKGHVPVVCVATPVGVALALALELGVGCSLIVNRADSQCSVDGDCTKFPGTVCVQGGCVPSGGIGDAGSEIDTSPPPPPPITSCTTTQECLPEHQGINWICRRSDGQCVSVVSQDCATIVGPYTRDEVVLLGALLPLTATHASTGQALQDAIRLAAGDFADGLPPVEDGGARRPIAVVFCNESDNVERAARHLRDDLRVPVILGTAFSTTTLQVAQDVTVPGGQLVMAPAAGSDLSTVAASGLVWRTIGADALQAHAMAKTLSLLEPQLQAAHAGTPVRVAVVYKLDEYGQGFDSLLRAELQFNGKSAQDNAADFLETDYGNPDEPGNADPETGYSDAISAVKTALPDLVILAGYTTAVTKVLVGIESNWPNGQPKPHYLLSNGMEVKELVALFSDPANDDLRMRTLGTSPGDNEASNADLSSFAVRYRQTFTDGAFPESYAVANAFDAVYATAFAVAATRNSDIVGADVKAGLRRIFTAPDSGTPVPIEARPTAIPNALTAIQGGAAIALHGVTGALAFDVTTGGVTSDVQVWCGVRKSATEAALTASGLFYSASDGQLHGSIDAACTH